MRDTLGFLELRLAPTQTVQRFLETRGHARESLREQANLIVSPNLGDLLPLTLCDRLSRLRQGGKRPQRASDHQQSEQQEDGDDGCADTNREIGRTIHGTQEIRGWERRYDGPLNFVWCIKAIDSCID